MESKLKVILTGSTGMVGEGVLYELLLNKRVEKVLVINRKSCGYNHPKLKEIIHSDFANLSFIESKLVDYDSCLFCAGVTSVGKKEKEFYTLTYTLTLSFAHTLARLNPEMTFCYISGQGTDSTEKGRVMWARVKGKTENDLIKLPFKAVYNFRPGALIPTKGLKNTKDYYQYISWILPLLRVVLPNSVCSLKDLALAMIRVSVSGYTTNTIEVKDIKILAKL